ncbi:MAG: hypothetical protein AB7E49_08975 [Campylobacterales bacterium]
MARIDEIKEFIGFLKLLFATVVAIDVSLVGWLVASFESAAVWQLTLGLSLAVLLSVILPLIVRKIIAEIKSLKDL